MSEDKNIYYVYVHRKLSDNSIFYVGKGCNGRCRSTSGRNLYWWEVVIKEKGFEPCIVEKDLDEVTCLLKEKSLIKELEKSGLTNISNCSDNEISNLNILEVKEELNSIPITVESKVVGTYDYIKEYKVTYENKCKESNLLILENYFEYEEGSLITVKDFKEFAKENKLKGLSLKSKNFISATKVANYFKQKYSLNNVEVKNVRVKELNRTCSCILGLKFK